MGRLLDYFSERGCLLEPDLASWLERQPDSIDLAKRALDNLGEVPFVLGLPMFQDAAGIRAPSAPLKRAGGGEASSAPRGGGGLHFGADALPYEQILEPKSLNGAHAPSESGRMPAPTAFAVPGPGPAPAPAKRAPTPLRPAETPTTPQPLNSTVMPSLMMPPRAKRADAVGAFGSVAPRGGGGLLIGDEESDDEEDGEAEVDGGRITPGEILGAEPIVFLPRSDWRPLSKEHPAEVRVLKDVTGKSECEGSTTDFVRYFQARYESLTKLLRQRREIANAVSLRTVNETGFQSKEFAMLGLVKEKWTTPNGHIFLELEDDSDVVRVLCHTSNAEVMGVAQRLVPDAVVGIVATKKRGDDRPQANVPRGPRRSGDLVIARQLVMPDIPMDRARPKVDVPLHAAFVGDLHIGSKKFLAGHWKHMLRWLHGQEGNSRQREAASRIKYLVLMGDAVDGIGVYPDQDKDLAIPDIFEQYQALAKVLEPIPDHMQIVFMPGNHDAVRPAEPQPAIDKELQKLFARNSVTFVANPSSFSLHGVEVLTYHGSSLVDYAKSVPGFSLFDPIPIMTELLRARHIAPVYGGDTPLAAEHTDYMVIDRVPDVFATGHVHACATSQYRGVQMINASTWQAQTDYQASQNFVPKPARLPIVDLKTMKQSVVDFSNGL